MIEMARFLLFACLAAGLLSLATPAAADDLMVPANAAGPLADFKGQAWFRPLAYCAAAYTEEANDLAAAGKTAAGESARDLGVGFFADASRRVATDRGLPFDSAMQEVGRVMKQWQFVVIALKMDPAYYPQAHGSCATIRKSYARATG
jgi:hypothetical protein